MNDFVIRFMSSKMWRVKDCSTIAIESDSGSEEKDKEYSYASTDNDHYLETYGGEVKLKLTTDLNLKTKYNNQLEKDKLKLYIIYFILPLIQK